MTDLSQVKLDVEKESLALPLREKVPATELMQEAYENLLRAHRISTELRKRGLVSRMVMDDLLFAAVGMQIGMEDARLRDASAKAARKRAKETAGSL